MAEGYFRQGGFELKDIACNIICDLIPLVKDHVASKESEEMVMDHIEDCQSCHKEFQRFESYETMDSMDSTVEDKRILSSIRRNIFISQMTILTLGAIVGVAITGTMGQFYNFIIMPILGALSLIVLKDRWHLGFVAVFVLSYIGQIIYFLLESEFHWAMLYGASIYGFIYISLMALGIVIFKLLKFAFGRGSGGHEER